MTSLFFSRRSKKIAEHGGDMEAKWLWDELFMRMLKPRLWNSGLNGLGVNAKGGEARWESRIRNA